MALLATKWPQFATPLIQNVQRLWDLSSHQFGAVLVRERRERSWNKLISSWEISCRLKGFLFWTFILIDLQGEFSRGLDVFPYFHVWGTQIYQPNILFWTLRLSFSCFKISVHLGFVKQIFTRKWFKRFRGL